MENSMIHHVKKAWQALTYTSGKFSHLKMWSNVALVVASWIVIKLTLQGTITVDMFVVYMASATGARITDKYLSSRNENIRHSYQYGASPYRRPPGSARTPQEDDI